jgi:DNA polymerase-3 subunit gamma/tau
MTLYLKYRPQSLDELDSKEARNSLKKIFSSGGVPHAFLFSGPKGIGKTSAARIVAKILNCESKKPPCGKCDQCTSIMKGNNIDVIEIDAASHGLVDDIRALRDVAKLSPAKAKKKIYIIDEAHMLSTAGSNALLKILEEPPKHVVFILATTNPEKLISTIRSRTTEIPFRKATLEEIAESLKKVIKGEKIKINDEELSLIAQRANGSFRDGVKILEQFWLEGSDFLKKGAVGNVEDFVELLFKKDLEALLANVKKRVEGGVSIEDFTKEILTSLHIKLLDKSHDKDELIELIELILSAKRQIYDSPIEELPLEVALIKWCGDSVEVSPPEPFEKDGEVQIEVEEKKVSTAKPVKPGQNLSEEVWKSILQTIRPINASIEALLRAAKPVGFDGKILTLGVFYKFHKERLEDGTHRRILEDVITQILGGQTKVACVLTDPPAKPVESESVLTEGKDQDIIKAAEEIFGV